MKTMKKEFTFLIISLLISFVFYLPKNGLAQEINDYSSDFSIEIIPNNPGPGEQVSAKIVSYQFDVDRSAIKWTLNDRLIAQGTGKKAVNFVAPSFGGESRLTIDITTDAGVKTSKTKKFTGNDIDFLWEAKTSAPAGYKGKTLPGYKSIIKISAIPHLFLSGNYLPASSVIYDWSLNYKDLNDPSGLGKNSFLVKLSDFGDYTVGLKVSSRDKRTSFQKFLHLSAENAEPKVVFYKDDPLEGPFYGKSWRNKVNLPSQEITIRAEPYFFNNEKGDVSYQWKMNEESVKPSKKPNTLSLRSEKNSGTAEIGLEIKKTGEDFTQMAEEFLKVIF